MAPIYSKVLTGTSERKSSPVSIRGRTFLGVNETELCLLSRIYPVVKMFVQLEFSISLLSQICACVLGGFMHKKHLFRNRKKHHSLA